MLASTTDEDGPGAPCGAARARGRRWSRGGCGPLLGGLVELAAALARPRRARAFGGGRDGCGARVVAGSLARGGDRARAASRVRLLVRDLDPLVDRARPLLGLLQPWARLRGVRGGRARRRRVRAEGASAVGVRSRGHRGARARV